MSREIAYVSNLSVSVDGHEEDIKSLLAYANMLGTKIVKSVTVLTATPKLIDTVEISSLGWAAFQNLDTANTVELTTSLSGPTFCKLLPGETANLRLGTNTPGAKTTSGTASLLYLICEN